VDLVSHPSRSQRDRTGLEDRRLNFYELRDKPLRKPDAAAACGLSDESFDKYVRPHVTRVRLGAVTVWPVDGLLAFLEARAEAPVEELGLEERAS
jgi:hypothetical protein